MSRNPTISNFLTQDAATIIAKAAKIRPLPCYPDIALVLDFNDRRVPNFHWFLFVPDRDQTDTSSCYSTGHKIHVKFDRSDRDAPRWVFESTEFALGAPSSALAVGAVIGQLKGDKSVKHLEGLLAQISLSVPWVDAYREKAFTCRVWMRQAIRVMHAAGFIYCPNVNKLEEEMKGYGKTAQKALLRRDFKFAKLVHAENSRTL